MKAVPHACGTNFNNFGGRIKKVAVVFILPCACAVPPKLRGIEQQRTEWKQNINLKRYAGCSCFVVSEILLDYACR
jgi:hypothetical protein